MSGTATGALTLYFSRVSIIEIVIMATTSLNTKTKKSIHKYFGNCVGCAFHSLPVEILTTIISYVVSLRDAHILCTVSVHFFIACPSIIYDNTVPSVLGIRSHADLLRTFKAERYQQLVLTCIPDAAFASQLHSFILLSKLLPIRGQSLEEKIELATRVECQRHRIIDVCNGLKHATRLHTLM
jgi:hypothetical protein